MRTKHLFLSMLAAMAMVGCSNEDVINPDNGNEAKGEPQYLTVSVNAAGAMTRADLQGDYEDGTNWKENEVEKVRFYFFDAEGNAAQVKGTQGGTYYDVKMSGNDKDMENVERILTATLVIQTPEKDKVPASIVAVVNPGVDTELGAVESLTKLNEVIKNYNRKSTDEKFLMSSAIYASGAKANKEDGYDNKMEAVSVSGHLFSTPEAALEKPVVLHVERVLAKARMTVGLEATENGLYKTSSDGSETVKVGDDSKEIYVKFLGWNVTATAEKSRLMKEINPSWSQELFSANLLWNTSDYYRCFWAVNPSNMSYTWGDFTEHAQAIKNFDAGTKTDPKVNYTYLQENASDDFTTGSNPKTPSQVIIAAQLVDKDGKPLEFAEFADGKAGRTDLDGLKKKYANLSKLWKKVEGEERYVKITPEELDLYTATEAGEANQNTPGRYKTYAKLNKDNTNTTWYLADTKPAEDATPLENIEAANAHLKSLGGAKVWTNGYTYYYFDIQHLNYGNNEEGKYGQIGIVRNHVYAANIRSLAGLGTPVYDPDEVIYPEKPSDDDTYIAAEIRILSWRVVNQDVDLEW